MVQKQKPEDTPFGRAGQRIEALIGEVAKVAPDLAAELNAEFVKYTAGAAEIVGDANRIIAELRKAVADATAKVKAKKRWGFK